MGSRAVRPEWVSSLITVAGRQVEVGRLEGLAPGPPVLALHCSGSTYRQWSKLSGPGARTVLAPNMYGYGGSAPWPAAPHRQPTIDDFTALLAAACPGPVHLLGHSMGGGIALATAALRPALPLASLAVFEPNLFCLLATGGPEDRAVYSTTRAFFHDMLEAAGQGDWDRWGRTFHAFWFEGSWESLEPGAREKLVATTTPQTVHEIQAILQTMEAGEEYARAVLAGLAGLQVERRVVLGAAQACGAAAPSAALAALLAREAGFRVVRAPAGGHMGPLTHPGEVLPLMLPQ